MKFIVITGPDASGKDTQIERMSSHLKSRGLTAQTLSIKNSLQDFAEVADIKTLNSILNVFLIKFEPQARSHFLLSLLKNSIAKINPNCDVVLYNGYWFKYLASESAYGVEKSFWEKNIESFPKPDLVIGLKASWESCKLRRSQWSAYEKGQALIASSLESFQTKMRNQLFSCLDEWLGNKAFIDADRDEDTISQEILNHVLQSLQKK